MPYYRRKKRYSSRRPYGRRYYSGLKRYKRKKSGYYGMRRVTTSQEKLLERGNRDTRKLSVMRLPTFLPDKAYVNFRLTGTTTATFQPLVGQNWAIVQPIAINRLFNVFNEGTGGTGISVQGYEEWAEFYTQYRVEAITFKIRPIMPSSAASSNTVQLMMIPREDDQPIFNPMTADMAWAPAQDKARSLIVNAEDTSSSALIYQTSIPVLTGEPMGQENSYEASFANNSTPIFYFVMDLVIYNVLNDGNFDPIKLEYQLEYHTRMSERAPLTPSQFIITGDEPRGVGKHTKYADEARDDSAMSSASTAISGFSQLMAARSMAGKIKR